MAKSSSAFCYIEIKTVLPVPVLPTIAILIGEVSIVSKGEREKGKGTLFVIGQSRRLTALLWEPPELPVPELSSGCSAERPSVFECIVEAL